MIPEKITFRLGHLAGPLGEWCDKHQIKPSEAARQAVAAMLGVDAPEMPVGNPDAGETLAAKRWKPKRTTFASRNQHAKVNTMYEVNANGNKSFRNASAKKVAEVAVTWKKNGFEPKVYAISEVDGKIKVNEAAVTTLAATAKALANAK